MTDSPDAGLQAVQGANGKPMPARAINGASTTPEVAAQVEEACIEIDGQSWTVRVLGRSGRASGASVPLVLLGFWEEGAADEGPSLEAMVVARSLDELAPQELASALAQASKPRDPTRPRPFFPEAGQSRGR